MANKWVERSLTIGGTAVATAALVHFGPGLIGSLAQRNQTGQPAPTLKDLQGANLKVTGGKTAASETPLKSEVNVPESKTGLASFTVETDADGEVDGSILKTANEPVPAKGDVRHTNTIGLGSEHFIAEPGVYTTSDIDSKDIKGGSAYYLSPDVQRPFTGDDEEFPLIEGGFAMITGAGMDLDVHGQTLTRLHLEAEKGHSWFVIVRGNTRDYQIDEDPNSKIIATNYNRGYVLGTILPPGQYVSQDYFLQNVESAHGQYQSKNSINCGTDGCSRVSVVLLDASTGAYTVIGQNSVNGPWELRATNIK